MDGQFRRELQTDVRNAIDYALDCIESPIDDAICSLEEATKDTENVDVKRILSVIKDMEELRKVLH